MKARGDFLRKLPQDVKNLLALHSLELRFMELGAGFGYRLYHVGDNAPISHKWVNVVYGSQDYTFDTWDSAVKHWMRLYGNG